MMTLQKRLFIIFLILFSVPTALLIFAMSHILSASSTYFAQAKGIEQSLQNSLEIGIQLDEGINDDILHYKGHILDEIRKLNSGTIHNLEGTVDPMLSRIKSQLGLEIVEIKHLDGFDELANDTTFNLSEDQIAMIQNDGSVFYDVNNTRNYLELVKLSTGDEGIHLLKIGKGIPGKLSVTLRELGKSVSLFSQLEWIVSKGYLKNFFWISGGILLFLSVGLSYILSHKLSQGISQPVEQLVNWSEKVAGGDLDSAVDIKASGEIKKLSDSFNKMIKDLKKVQQDLIEAEKLAAWQETARRVAHEIKNPLTPIRLSIASCLKAISTDDVNKAKLYEALEVLEIESQRLKVLAEEFSQFARLPDSHPTKLDFRELIDSVVRTYSPLNPNVKLETSFPVDFPEVNADYHQMVRVFSNLIKNSYEAMGGKGTLNIYGEFNAEDGKISISVHDSGEGIDQEIKDRIFEPYFTTKAAGTGLGLAIVKKMIEGHDGEINVESEKEKGAKIRITLPASPKKLHTE